MKPGKFVIHVYAFEGAGTSAGAILPAMDTVAQEAATVGALSIPANLDFHDYYWWDWLDATKDLNSDLQNKGPNDKFAVIGYSAGADEAYTFAIAAAKVVTWNIVFTIDPVGLGALSAPPMALAKNWVNYWQNTDTSSFLGLFGIHGQKIDGVDNEEVKAKEFRTKQFYLKLGRPTTATQYPTGPILTGNPAIAHLCIPYYKPLLDNWKNSIAGLGGPP